MGLRKRSLFNNQEAVVFVTTATFRHLPVFSEDAHCKILMDSLVFLRDKYGFKIIAYVVMPSHVHLVLCLPHGDRLSDIMRDFKKFTCFAIRKRLELDGRQNELEKLRENAADNVRQVFKLWQDRFDDLMITQHDTLMTKINYIHGNPVKSGLASEPNAWKYSSARNYYLGDHSVIRVDTDWLP